MLPCSHWLLLEASLRSRRRTGAESRAHITATAGLRAAHAEWAQCLSWPLIGQHSSTQPLIGQCLSFIATGPDVSSLISAASDLTPEEKQIQSNDPSHVTGHLDDRALAVSISIFMIWSKQVFWKLKIVLSLILEFVHHVLWKKNSYTTKRVQ